MALKIHWQGNSVEQASAILRQQGGMIVSPTKVGYIIMAADHIGLERKFAAKERKRDKPGVVLCSDLEQLITLAEVNAEIMAFYKDHWDKDILLGCILPWKTSGRRHLPPDQSHELMMDKRGTSCFVIKFGLPAEQIVTDLWRNDRRLVFASSANPSGRGNRGLLSGIGEKIENEADLLIEADAYVASIQPDADLETRYEQGVMVSLVDAEGKLIPEQQGRRMVTPCPVVIRQGLDLDRILSSLARHFPAWDYRHGAYY